MAEIRLVDVTRVFRPGATYRFSPRGRGLAGDQWDRAFAERVAAQAELDATETAEHGEVRALDHVNLTVPDGQAMAVIGPSGCGKSSLLRVVAGLDGDYTGDVFYDQQNMAEVPPKDRYIGMVFQNYALYPHFPGSGNLSFFFRVRKTPDAEVQARIQATAEIMGFGFNQLLDRKPGTLSGGQQQRLAIARALVRNPRLFLFDEPLSNLDARLRVQTRIEIKRLLHRFRITALYVTHDQEEAISLGDQIAVMRAGRVAQVGTFTALRDDPVSAFVAGFLGRPATNLIEGVLDANGNLQVAGTAFPLPAALLSGLARGQALTLGVRPETAWVCHPGQPGPAGPRLPGEVELVEPDYGQRTQNVRVVAGATDLGVIGPLDPSIRLGDRVEVVLPVEGMLVFDTTSGVRVK